MKTCKICRSVEVNVIAQLLPKHGGRCDVLQCHQCGFLWADPLPDFTPEFLNQIYGEAYTEQIRSLEGDYESRRTLYQATVSQLDLLEKYLPSSPRYRKALNIGAMTISSKVLLDQGWDLTAVEVSDYAARSAAEKWDMQVVHGKIENVTLPTDVFDLIKLSHVIEHLADPLAVLHKLHSTMKRGGILLLETDNSAGLKTWLEVSVRRLLGEAIATSLVYRLTQKNLKTRYGRLIPYEHVSLFNQKNLLLAVQNVGFVPIQILCPAQGDPVWFPFTNQAQRWTPLERLMSYVDALGAKIGRGEVLVMLARKE